MFKERMALFFDGANHSEALSKAHVRLDYRGLIQGLEKNYRVVSARYYSGISDDEKYKGVRDFLGSLAKTPIVLVTKPVRTQADGSIKGNVDIEIVVDMMTMAPRLDRIVLFSGDGDYVYAIDTLQRMGVFVTVCSHKDFASHDLRDQANEFLEVSDLAKAFKNVSAGPR